MILIIELENSFEHMYHCEMKEMILIPEPKQLIVQVPLWIHWNVLVWFWSLIKRKFSNAMNCELSIEMFSFDPDP